MPSAAEEWIPPALYRVIVRWKRDNTILATHGPFIKEEADKVRDAQESTLRDDVTVTLEEVVHAR